MTDQTDTAMRVYVIFLLFFSTLVAQNKPLELKITSLKKIEDTQERKFELTYTLTNLTDKKVSFFFNPQGFGGVMSNRLYHKCYQNNEYIDSDSMFKTYSNNAVQIDLKGLDLDGKTEQQQADILKNYLRETLHIDLDSINPGMTEKEILLNIPQRRSFENMMQNRCDMAANEVKSFTQTIYWNKARYFTVDPHEYYVDETAKHHFEITLVLVKELLKDKIPDADYASIIADDSFIKGVFISNKVEIDLGK